MCRYIKLVNFMCFGFYIITNSLEINERKKNIYIFYFRIFYDIVEFLFKNIYI